mgnify:CR=1 FL=1
MRTFISRKKCALTTSLLEIFFPSFFSILILRKHNPNSHCSNPPCYYNRPHTIANHVVAPTLFSRYAFSFLYLCFLVKEIPYLSYVLLQVRVFFLCLMFFGNHHDCEEKLLWLFCFLDYDFYNKICDWRGNSFLDYNFLSWFLLSFKNIIP